MNLMKKFVSAVSAAALAVTALTAAYAPLTYAEGYDAVQNAASVGTENISYVSDTEEYSGFSGLGLSDINASKKADFTVMIYMVGSNLESDYGHATEDIKEICKGYTGSKVNVIIQTGGSTEWQNSNISSKKCQRFQVTSKGLKLVDDTLGQQDMSNKNTLCNFIKYCKKNYAASRYGLVLWDHGGGTVYGFGNDDNYDGNSMSMLDYKAALKKAGVHFDFVGFDACLMTTLEVALLTADHADYLIGAENLESGIGWYHTDWIRALCKNPKMTVTALGKTIADGTVKKSMESFYDLSDDGISVINLKKVESTVIPALNSFSKNSISMLTSKKYSTIAKNRAANSVENQAYELVDICQYASSFYDESFLTKSAASLRSAVKKAVVYHKGAGLAEGLCGLSMTFPFDDLGNLDLVCDIYEAAGCDTTYTDFLIRFANIMAGGQQYCMGSDEKYNYSACDWYDTSQFYHDNYYARFYLGSTDEAIPVQKVNGRNVVKMTSDMQEMISSYVLTMHTLEKKGSSYVETDYGTDNVARFDSYGNLIVEYDGTWVSLNGKPITCYYYTTASSGSYTRFLSCAYGKYNGYDAIIYLLWDNDTYQYPDNGLIWAWEPIVDDASVSRLYACQKGDRFKVYKSVYKNSKWYWTYDNTVYTVGKTKLNYSTVKNSGDIAIRYEITDIFNNVFYTEWVWR